MFASGITPDLASAIAVAAHTLYEQRTVDETLQRIAQAIHDSVPGFDHVGVSTVSKDAKVVVATASAGTLAPRLDDIQYALWEGPCVDALNGTDVVSAPELRHEQRWARYVPQVVSLGVRSQLAVRLHRGADTIGSINLYSTVSGEVSQDVQVLALLFATHSAAALGHAQERADFAEALKSRKVIGQAIGVLMERYDLSEEHAFAYLRRTSSHSNIKVRAIAQELVDGRSG